MAKKQSGLYKRGNVWWIRYTDHLGRRFRKAASTDENVAAKMLGDALLAVEKMRGGMIQSDPSEARKAPGTHLDDYLADMERQGRDPMYRYTIRKRVEAVVKGCGWQRMTDCTARSIAAHLGALASGTKGKPGLTAKTVNDYRGDLSGFFGWCVKHGRMESNPCAAVEKSKVKREKKRRALSVAECESLLNAAPASRKLVYRFLIFTGVRRGEAEALKWGDLRLESLNPSVSLPATITKSGQPETIPLVPALAALLLDARSEATDADPVFGTLPTMVTFREDLAAAKIDEVDERGRMVVLHSLRHSLATMLAVSGVPMAVAQRIMRHRDIRLTAETYTDEGLLPLADAMRSLPIMHAPDQREELRATGTTDCASFVPKGGTNGSSGAPTLTLAGSGESSETTQNTDSDASTRGPCETPTTARIDSNPRSPVSQPLENTALAHGPAGDCAKSVSCSGHNGGAEAGRGAETVAVADADLMRLVRSWDSLPAAIRAAVVALVKACEGQQ